jgi:hypothetical protein
MSRTVEVRIQIKAPKAVVQKTANISHPGTSITVDVPRR